MTPQQKHPSEQAATETDSEQKSKHMAGLSHAIDAEHKENHHSQENCLDDCKEHDL